ncbi:MAG: FAD-binding oxidoreductase [Hellea sp.]|nr:FAD-binding oxidoreductase [Hellea sp.]
MSGLKKLKNALPEASWTDDKQLIAPWVVEWRDKYQGNTPLMVMPSSSGEVQTIVNICRNQRLKIVPQGGNTGLVGGNTPYGEVLLSTRRMNRVRDINPVTNSLIAEAGTTLLSVQEAAASIDRKFPLSLASEGSCTIGGNLSTNAGGVHVLKYGTARDLVFGVEAVLPSGEIFNGLTNLRKDNTGYDLSRLFLGAEGTLGIITAASLKLFPRAGHVQRVMVGLETIADAISLLDHCRAGNALSMFEVMPRIGLELVTRHIPDQKDPFEDVYPWYALIDWEVGDEAMGRAISEDKLMGASQEGLIEDAIIAQSETQAVSLLALRENMSAGQKFLGGSVKLDITIPIDRISEFLCEADQAVEKIVPACRPVAFGHLGDGNIHYNVGAPENAATEEFLSNWQKISDAVFDLVDKYQGSISAEHGIGTMKKDDLAKRADPAKIKMMRAIKQSLDPDNMMNPRVMI